MLSGKDVRGRRHQHRAVRRTATLAMVVCTAAATTISQAACSPSTPSTFAYPFAATSPWRQPIPSSPQIDPNSAEIIAHLQPEPRLPANLAEFAVPIYRVSADTRTHRVTCTKDWGVCPFAGWSPSMRGCPTTSAR